jgi:adenylate cyclase
VGEAGRARVLIVDDDATNRDLLVRLVERQGLAAAVAEDGERALAAVQAGPVDLVLLDLVMPGLGGLQVLERLKADAALRHIPVIVISSLDDLTGIAACIRLGAEDYLPRPFDAAILRARIEASLERKRRHDEERRAQRGLEQSTHVLEARVQQATATLQRRLRELSGMIDVARSIISVLDLDSLFTQIMQLSKDVMSAEASSLLVADAGTRTLRFLVATGAAGKAIAGGTIQFGQGIAGYVAETGESVLIPDAYQDPRFDPSYDRRSGFRTRSILTVPLRTAEGIVGVLQVMNKIGQDAFDQHDLDLFQSFASMAGVSLHNARLFEQLRKTTDDLRVALEKERWLSIEKEKMGAYIPKNVVDEISRNREQKLALGGKTVTATVLFSDIQGFTSLSERLPPEQVVGFLNEYMTAMTQRVEDEGGIVDKFIGDGIMAVFLPRGEDDNHALRAVRAGLGMQERLAELKAGWRERRPEVAGLAARIGVNTGEMVAGNIGSETRMDYTVIGDNVNLAARIEASGRGGEVHVSEAVYRRVRAQVTARALGSLSVRNRVLPVEIYAVDGLAPDAAAGAARPGPPA